MKVSFLVNFSLLYQNTYGYLSIHLDSDPHLRDYSRTKPSFKGDVENSCVFCALLCQGSHREAVYSRPDEGLVLQFSYSRIFRGQRYEAIEGCTAVVSHILMLLSEFTHCFSVSRSHRQRYSEI